MVAVLGMAGSANASFLMNGDFEIADINSGYATNWDAWAWGDSPFNEHTVKDFPQGGNNTLLLNVGNGWYQGGAGAYQTVAATAGTNYMLTVDCGADGWWQPTGEMALIFLDATGTNELSKVAKFTVDEANGIPNDTLQPMQNYQLIGTAPVGAEFVKVEFASRMPGGQGGAITWDNAVLDTTAIPEPATLAFLGLAGSALLFLRRLNII